MFRLFKFYSPVDAPSGGTATGATTSGTPSGNMGKEDVIDFLGGDDEDKETIELDDAPRRRQSESADDKGETDKDEKDESDSQEEETEEKDELDELEDELQGPTEEQLELVTPVRRKEILKKYPTLFKDFPYLEKAYYREQQFTEVFPTIDDAKIASDKSAILDRFESDVKGGNIQTVLQAVHKDDVNAFYHIVDNILGTIANVDQNAFQNVIGNVTKQTIISMVQEGKRSNNEALRTAAQILNQFVFGSSDFEPPKNLSKGKDKEDNKEISELQRREHEFNTRQLTTAVEGMNTKVNNTLQNTVEANIDPKSSMTDYVKKTAVKQVLSELETLVGQDTRFKTLTNTLWERAIQSNYSKESMDRIKSAYLSKAKTLLPSVIKKARTEALRGMGKRVNDSDETPTESSTRKGPVSVGRPRSSSNSGKITEASKIPQGMKTIDFLNTD